MSAFEERLALHRTFYAYGAMGARQKDVAMFWDDYPSLWRSLMASYQLGHWHRTLYAPQKLPHVPPMRPTP